MFSLRARARPYLVSVVHLTFHGTYGEGLLQIMRNHVLLEASSTC